MLRKILFSNVPIGFFISAVAGALVGFFLLMATLNAWHMYRAFTTSQHGDSDQYVTINKEVSLFNSINSDLSSFTQEEIDSLRKAKFVDDLAPFLRSTFGVEASRKASSNMPRMRTEMFFEAVPDRFLDKIPENWDWEPGKKHIPVIIPKEYLNLYNFGFAKAQGLPNVSEGVIGRFNFEMELYNRHRLERFTGSIAGFTNRIQSLLVPFEFLKTANKRFAPDKAQKPDRLILKLEPNMEKDMYAYLSEHGYETTHDAFQGGKVSLFVHTSGGVLLGLAALIIVLALIVYALTLQLTVQRNKDEVYQLMMLGYKHLFLFRKYFVVQAAIAIFIFILNILAILLITNYALDFLASRYINLSTFSSGPTILITGGVMLGFLLITAFNTSRLIKKLAVKGTL